MRNTCGPTAQPAVIQAKERNNVARGDSGCGGSKVKVVTGRAAFITGGASGIGLGIAEAFVAICSSYSLQLAIRGDLDPAPFTAAIMTIVKG